MPNPATIRIKVWDPWIRMVHWGLVGLLGGLWWSGKTGRLDLHMTLGHCVLALLLFRLAWGFVGSDTARFRAFLRSPMAAFGHLRHLFHRAPDTEIGHNAAGGWMVLVLLLVLLTQAVSGLFADDLIFTRGPLAGYVSGNTSDWATWIHLRNFNLILVLAALHILAVLIYALGRGQDLVRPMVTGVKRLPASLPVRAPRLGSPLLAVLLLLAAGAAVWGISRLG
ncbi:cytochrome b/b6 domain-containing protein [Teichococcus vastitatis]|uniref:Cytochrome b/b6 domain-containing protein n=1 Tax=Teichococcus vastitatis TaxID=2307076 RepID=A0ABS9W3S9_9PROT|nr:cytochrome b/b6 domain-containing protein [Pseudoroseomonas vastitatis]MCI0753946.1 cytochrome b/b6 domain-containing protein [Pseudoroseomonas vastitatis]